MRHIPPHILAMKATAVTALPQYVAASIHVVVGRHVLACSDLSPDEVLASVVEGVRERNPTTTVTAEIGRVPYHDCYVIADRRCRAHDWDTIEGMQALEPLRRPGMPPHRWLVG